MVLLEEGTGKVTFANKSAKVFKVEENQSLISSGKKPDAGREEQFEMSIRQFGRVDDKLIRGAVQQESRDIVEQIQNVDDFISLEDVIKLQSTESNLKNSFVYKVRQDAHSIVESAGRSNSESAVEQEQSQTISKPPRVSSLLKNKFVAFRVNKINHNNENVVGVFIRDLTRKIKSKIDRKEQEESQQSANQAESYSATLSHEMKTPIASVTFFLKRIIQ